MNAEQQIVEINASLKTIGDQLKSHAEQADKDIKAHAKLSEETRASVDKLLTEQGSLHARLQTAEQLLATLKDGGRAAHEAQTVGAQLIEDDGFKAWAGKASQGASFTMGVKAVITSDPASGGSLIVPQRIPGVVATPQQRLTIRDLLSWGRTVSNSLEFVRETGFTNNAAPVGENPSGGKPQSNITMELDSAKVATIAHYIRVTKQVLSDVPMLQSYIDGRLQYGLKLNEELELLKGSGVGLNIDGIYTQASAYANPGVTVQAETRMDRIRLALLQAELAEYYADGIVLNPIDWCAIELTKNDQNDYLFANPRFIQQPALWGRPVVSTKSMDVNDFLVGAFQMGAQGWDREDVNLTVALQDQDNTIKNMVTLLVEERVGLTVYRPEAFVKGNFTGVNPVPPTSA
jgi:HK97 family phage major capsid protein